MYEMENSPKNKITYLPSAVHQVIFKLDRLPVMLHGGTAFSTS